MELLRVRSRGFWATTSQISSSGSNFVIALVAIRSLPLEEFGQFSLAYLTLTTAILVTRSTVGQTILLANAGSSRRGYAGVMAMATLATGTATFAVSLLVLGDLSAAVILGVAGLIAMVQDTGRYLAIVEDRWDKAALSDFIWLVLMVSGAFGFSALRADIGVSETIALWAVAGLLSTPPVLSRSLLPDLRFAGSWVRTNRATLAPLSGESLLINVSGYAVNWIATLFGGFAGVGLFRAIQVVMSPVSVLSQSATLVLLRSSPSADAGRDRPVARPVFVLGLLMGATIAWFAALQFTAIGPVLFADSWSAVEPLIALVALGQCFAVVGLVSVNMMKIRFSSHSAFVFRSAVVAISPLAVALGGSAIPLSGAALGQIAAQILTGSIAVLWLYGLGLRLRLRARSIGPEPKDSGSGAAP